MQRSTATGGWESKQLESLPLLGFPAGYVECCNCHSCDTVPAPPTEVTVHVLTPVPRAHRVRVATEATCTKCQSLLRVPCVVYGCIAAPIAGPAQWYDIQSTSLYRSLLLKSKTSIQGYTDALEHLSCQPLVWGGTFDRVPYKASKLTTGKNASFSRAMQQHREIDNKLNQMPTGKSSFDSCYCCSKRAEVPHAANHGLTVCADGSYSVGPRQRARKALVAHNLDGMLPDVEVYEAVAADSVKRRGARAPC